MNNYTLLTDTIQKLPLTLPLALPRAVTLGKDHASMAFLSLNPALGFAECRHRLGITIEQAHGFCSRLALPLHLDYVYCIFGEKTNLRLSEGRDACIDG